MHTLVVMNEIQINQTAASRFILTFTHKYTLQNKNVFIKVYLSLSISMYLRVSFGSSNNIHKPGNVYHQEQKYLII